MVLEVHRAQLQGMLQTSEPMLLMALERLVRAEHAAVVDGIPTDLLQRMLCLGRDSAQGYGLLAPNQVAAFALLMFEFGPEFHHHLAVRDVLDDRSLPAVARLEAVCRDTPDAVWREIEASLHRQTWFPETRTHG